MADAPSFQEFLTDFSTEIFVGRGEQLVRFEKALITERPPFLILAISGPPGVGKTTLLEQFNYIADDHAVLTGLAREEQTSVPATLAHFARQFDEVGHTFTAFAERYARYLELKALIEADPQAPQDILDFALRSATRISKRSLRRTPVRGDALDVQVRTEVEDLVSNQDRAMAAYVAETFSDPTDRALLLETDAELTRHFLQDLNHHAQQRRIILFFDAYEKTAVYLDGWFQEVLAGKFGQFSSRVFFIIAGQHPLEGAWSRFRKATRQVKLREFTEAEAQEYLDHTGFTDEAQINTLLELSEYMPVQLAFLVSAPGGIPDLPGTALERFLAGATAEQREATLVASVPQVFNEAVLTELLDPEAASNALEWLGKARFVDTVAGGFSYHEVIRGETLRHFRTQSLRQYNETHRKLADYYAAQAQAQALNLSEEQRHLDETWRWYEQQRLYHRLSQNPPEHLTEVFGSLLTNLWSDIALAEEERKRAALRDTYTILQQVAVETDEPVISAWAERLAQVLIVDREDRAQEIRTFGEFFSALGNLDLLDERERSLAFLLAGAVYAEADPDLALSNLSKAVELQPEDASNYYWRGHIHLEAKDYAAAVDNFSKIIELQPDNSDNYYWRGRTHLEARDYAATLSDFNQALELQPDDALSYQGRGITHMEQQNYATALADLSQAVALEPSDGDNFYWRGRAYLAAKEYEAALTDFSEAINLQPGNDDDYYWRGMTHLTRQEYDAALADLSEAIDLNPDNAASYHNRGLANLHTKHYRAALNDFSQALDLDPTVGASYRGRAQAYLGLGDERAAVDDFGRAIAQDDKDVVSYEQRARLRVALNQPAAALDCDRNLAPHDAGRSLSSAWRIPCRCSPRQQ
jgi:tetratricopeptide (TPR) repeat protein